VANFTVLSVALIIFAVMPQKVGESVEDAQILQFRVLDVIIIGIGFFSTTFYVMFIREVPLSKAAKELDQEYKKA
jgi:hypothetical protein